MAEKKWDSIIQSMSAEDVPARSTKSRELYKRIEEALAQKDAVSVNAKALNRNLYSMYYGIRNHFLKKGTLDKYTFHIRPKEDKVYIKKKK